MPLIHLAEINLFNTLNIFEKVFITSQVYGETSHLAKIGGREVEDAIKNGWIKIEEIQWQRYLEPAPPKSLNVGEVTSIALSKKMNAIFISDDLDARDYAESIGLIITGSVGIIFRSFREKRLTLAQAEKALIDLYEKSTLFISKKVVDAAMKAVKAFEIKI